MKLQKNLIKRKKQEAESKIPELADINAELASIGAKVLRAALEGDDIDQKISEFKRDHNYLLSKRAQLLTENGYPEDYLDVVYECPICNDVGFVGMKMCSCMKNAIALAEYEESGISNLMKEQRFETFSLDYYTGVDKEVMSRNYSILKSYAESFDENTSQVLRV